MQTDHVHWMGGVILRPGLGASNLSNTFYWADPDDVQDGSGTVPAVMFDAVRDFVKWAAEQNIGWGPAVERECRRIVFNSPQMMWEIQRAEEGLAEGDSCGIFLAAFVSHVTTRVPEAWGSCVPRFRRATRSVVGRFVRGDSGSTWSEKGVPYVRGDGGSQRRLWFDEDNGLPTAPPSPPGDQYEAAQRIYTAGHTDYGTIVPDDSDGPHRRAALAAAIVGVTQEPVIRFLKLIFDGFMVDDVSNARSMDLNVVLGLLREGSAPRWLPELRFPIDGDSDSSRKLDNLFYGRVTRSERVRTAKPPTPRTDKQAEVDRARLVACVRVAKHYGNVEVVHAAAMKAHASGECPGDVLGGVDGDHERWASSLLSSDGVDQAVDSVFNRMRLRKTSFISAVATILDAMDSWRSDLDRVARAAGLRPFMRKIPLLWWGPTCDASRRQPVHAEEEALDNEAPVGSWGGRAGSYGPSAIFAGGGFETDDRGLLCGSVDSTRFYYPLCDMSDKKAVRASFENPARCLLALERNVVMGSDARVLPFTVRFGHSKAWHSGGPSSTQGNSRYVIHCATSKEVSQCFPWSLIRARWTNAEGRARSRLDDALFAALAGDDFYERRGAEIGRSIGQFATDYRARCEEKAKAAIKVQWPRSLASGRYVGADAVFKCSTTESDTSSNSDADGEAGAGSSTVGASGGVSETADPGVPSTVGDAGDDGAGAGS